MSLYAFKDAYVKMLESEGSDGGAMSSGPILDASISDPQHGVYGLWNPITKTKKKFKSHLEKRNFMESNPGWEELKESIENCPICGEKYVTTCRCTIGNKSCKNGHDWYVNKDGETVLGTGHGGN